MKFCTLFLALSLAFSAMASSPYAKSESEFMGKFNHLAISGNIGTLGYGFDFHMPVSSKVVLRAGFNLGIIGNIYADFTNTLKSLPQIGIIDADFANRVNDKPVTLLAKPTLANFNFLAEYYPWKTTDFHFVGGLFLGGTQVLDLKNKEDGSLIFLYEANEKVSAYNREFKTNFNPIGLQFGDYIFTANEKGNIRGQLRTWAVKPYIGMGFGRSVSNIRKVRVLFDFGLMFWGKPTVDLNGEVSIKPSKTSEQGFMRTISEITAFPVIQIRFAGNIF